jgi:GNAT superfamily N-acetyltransferase
MSHAASTRPSISRNLVVRPAVTSDADALVALAAAFHQQQGDTPGQFTPEAIARDVVGPQAVVQALIAELDDKPVGFAFLLTAYDSAHAARGFSVSDFFVTDDARARGVGRVVMAACAAFARRQNGSFLWWVSKAWNVEAQKFYRTISPVEEPIMAHALTSETFSALAGEGEAHFVE